MAFFFNLCSTVFIDYIFADVGTLMQGRASPEFLAGALASFEMRPEVTVGRRGLGYGPGACAASAVGRVAWRQHAQ